MGGCWFVIRAVCDVTGVVSPVSDQVSVFMGVSPRRELICSYFWGGVFVGYKKGGCYERKG